MRKRMTVAHGVTNGKEHRKAVPRKDLGMWNQERRKHGPAALLAAAAVGRVPALLKIKQQRMSASAFGFFRGAAAIMAYDLSLCAHTNIETQLCGDAHVQNLGAYAGIDGKLIFDINDFDETIRGPFEWDLKRLATSILLAGHEAGIGNGDCSPAALEFLDAYCSLMDTLAGLPVLEVARYPVRRLEATAPIAKILGKAERASPAHLLDRLTEPAARHRVFRSEPPLLRRVHGEEREQVLGSLTRYRAMLLPERRHLLDQYRPLDVAFKVVGTGSVGLRDYCIYLEGNGADDPLFLQIKQEADSVYMPYLKQAKSTPPQNGQRVAQGQRAMQLQSDPLLGWTSMGGHDYLVRQLNDHKASLDVTTLSADGLTAYARICGEMLARGHARSSNAKVIAEYIGGGKAFGASILRFATSYAKQTRLDFKAVGPKTAG
jgi:uncharacterized protein (DUF2252 family)